MPRTSLGAGCRQLGPLRSGRSDSLFGANYRFAARLLGREFLSFRLRLGAFPDFSEK